MGVFNVAKYILEQRGSMSTMKLQKLCYYAQAWSLVWDESPLFDEPIEAWIGGPIVRELYNRHRGRFTVTVDDIAERSNCLSQDNRDTIDQVIEDYGNYSGQELSQLTHREQPWRAARRGLSPNERGKAIIDPMTMQEYYTSLIAE